MKKCIACFTELFRGLMLCRQALQSEMYKVKDMIFYSEVNNMFKNIFRAIEAMVNALIYFFILLMGLTGAALGAFIVLLTAFRLAQFLWILIFKEAWL